MDDQDGPFYAASTESSRRRSPKTNSQQRKRSEGPGAVSPQQKQHEPRMSPRSDPKKKKQPQRISRIPTPSSSRSRTSTSRSHGTPAGSFSSSPPPHSPSSASPPSPRRSSSATPLVITPNRRVSSSSSTRRPERNHPQQNVDSPPRLYRYSPARDRAGCCCRCQPACRCGDHCLCSQADQLLQSLPPSRALPDANDNDAQQTIQVTIIGMTCHMCSSSVETAVRALHTVHSIDIDLTTDSARIVADKDVPLDTIQAAIEDIGYTVPSIVRVVEENGEEGETVEERWQLYRQRQVDKVQRHRSAFLWSLLGTLPVLVLTMILPLTRLPLHRDIVFFRHTWDIYGLVLAALATPVQFICGWDFYKHAWHGFWRGQPGMDLLVALGTTAAYSYALSGVWNHDHHTVHFFETSVVLLSFVNAGKWMQAVAVRRTSEALTQLMQLQSPTAVRVSTERPQSFHPDHDRYEEEIVDIQEIQVGDIVKVIRGAKVPTDGKLLYGEMSIDESMVTGESVPVLKTAGGNVLGGTMCVECGDSGQGFVQVTRVGSSTALAQIVQMVQDAQTRAVPIQSFADQVSGIFVPVVCTVSLLTYMVWYALCSAHAVPEAWYHDEGLITFCLKFAIACLVISCPCALGLATPTAVMVGTGVGASKGVLMKGGEALEIASKVSTVVFDKTGTLTKGTPVVTDFHLLSDLNAERLDVDSEERQSIMDYVLWLLGSLERSSEHPLGKAIVEYATGQLGEALEENPFVQPTKFSALTGRGASGTILDKVVIAAGNRSFAVARDLRISPHADFCMKQLELDGKTAIFAAVDDQVAAIIGISDQLNSDALDAVTYLRDEMGVEVWMATGDNERTANAISRKLGLDPDRVISEALPAAKLEKIIHLQGEGKVVAMVGDGVNDSPALAQADVGISIGTGTEIAAEASDMVLVQGHLKDVCTALHLSRAIFRRIQWNLLFSLLYNCLAIPLAAGALYPFLRFRLPPTVAAIAMALSSISVVLSSLSLRWYRPPSIESPRNVGVPTVVDVTLDHDDGLVILDGDEVDDMHANLLANDHLLTSEMTQRIDNRTMQRLEEGTQ